MGRRKKQDDQTIGCIGLIIFGIVFVISLWDSYSNVFIAIIIGVVILTIVGLIMSSASKGKRIQALRALKLADVDNMNGLEFEHYVSNLLEHQGFRSKVTKASADFGVDIVAEKNNVKYAVQVKRYNSSVSRRAVSHAVAGKAHYGCKAAMVITNNYFTKGATELANSTGCELIDRDALAEWILDFNIPDTTNEVSQSQSTAPIQNPLFTPTQWLILSLLGVGFIGIYGCIIIILALQ